MPQKANVLLDGGDGCFDYVADLVRDNSCSQVLILQTPLSRLEEIGVIPNATVGTVKNLERGGVDGRIVTTIPGRPLNRWDGALCLESWMQDHPREFVHVVCEQHQGRIVRTIIDHSTKPSIAARITVAGLQDQRFVDRHWWKSRRGWTVVLNGWISFAHVNSFGAPDDATRSLSAAEFENRMIKKIHPLVEEHVPALQASK